MSKVHIVEVGLRDGLQNIAKRLSVNDRYQLVKKLSLSGVRRLELGSFVSPRVVPNMQGTYQLVQKVMRTQQTGKLPQSMTFFAFVPNLYGFEQAVKCGLKEVSFFVACTEKFSKKNINSSIKDSFKSLSIISKQAQVEKIKLRVYLSVAFHCPYEGRVRASRVAMLADRIMQTGAWELAISDTIGVAVPSDVLYLLDKVYKYVSSKNIALHFHDTRGMGLANVAAGLDGGVRVFDASIGGLGGCPYAPGASGNIATEDLVYMLENMSFKTGICIRKLINTTHFLENKLQQNLSAKLAIAGLPPERI